MTHTLEQQEKNFCSTIQNEISTVAEGKKQRTN